MDQDIVGRLRVDPGKRTFGELLQEREVAAHEIRQLRKKLERHIAIKIPPRIDDDSKVALAPIRPGTLIRLTSLCEILDVSRSTIYRWMSEGMFPKPVRISERAVRWRSEDIEHWRNAL